MTLLNTGNLPNLNDNTIQKQREMRKSQIVLLKNNALDRFDISFQKNKINNKQCY